MEFRREYLHAVIPFCLLICALSCDAVFYIRAEWDFNSHDRLMTVPMYTADENFIADLSPLGTDINSILVPGKESEFLTCVYVNGKSFNLATNLGSTCLSDIDACVSPWGAEFFLKIDNWKVGGNNVIMRTTDVNRTSPGIYIGKWDDDSILLYLRGSSGNTLQKTFSQELFMRKWARLSFLATESYLVVWINGRSSRRAEPETLPATTTVTPANFVVGDENGPTFYLDNVIIRYSGDGVKVTNATTRPVPVIPSTESTTTATPMSPTTTTTTTIPNIAYTTQFTTTAAKMQETTKRTMTSTKETIVVTTASSSITSDDYSNIWIPILIALLAVLAVALCIVFVMCCKRRKKSRNNNQQLHELTERQSSGAYVRTSTVEPFYDDSSQVDTDRDTDREDNNGRLLQNRPRK